MGTTPAQEGSTLKEITYVTVCFLGDWQRSGQGDAKVRIILKKRGNTDKSSLKSNQQMSHYMIILICQKFVSLLLFVLCFLRGIKQNEHMI